MTSTTILRINGEERAFKKMEQLNGVLMEYMLRPRWYGPLQFCNGRGEALGKGGRLVVELQIEDDHVREAGFEVSGDDTLMGCTSFVLDCLRGQSLGWAACMRPYVFQWPLGVASNDAGVETAVRAVRAAIAFYRRVHDKPSKPLSERISDRRGHRNTTRLPPPTRRDLALLQPGESYEALMEERGHILGVLQNMARCLEIGSAFSMRSRDVTSSLREEIICLTLDVVRAVATLPEDDRRLIDLVGMQAMTETEAATVLGVSQSTVHDRVRAIAYRVQRILRGVR